MNERDRWKVPSMDSDTPAGRWCRENGFTQESTEHEANVKFLRDYAPGHLIREMFTAICEISGPWEVS